MTPKRVAIACQGGGSQCAFVAGVLKTLFAQRVHDQHRIVALSGTSGGALTAALAWAGLLGRAHGDHRPIEGRLLAFWEDLAAQTPQEMVLDASSVQLLRLADAGLLPTVATGPASPGFQLWSEATASLVRPEFTDLRALLLKHFDFEALHALVQEDSPALLVGAADPLQGTVKVFTSARREIGLDSLLASACFPVLFPPQWVDGHPYWDATFCANPPIVGFLKKALMGKQAPPDEIWIIQVNPTQHRTLPDRPGEIFDRRNLLAGNLSLVRDIELIEMVNQLLHEHALTDQFRVRFGLDTTRPVTLRFVRMSPAIEASLDYPGKLSRQPSQIARLIADGEIQAEALLAELRNGERAAGSSADRPPFETH